MEKISSDEVMAKNTIALGNNQTKSIAQGCFNLHRLDSWSWYWMLFYGAGSVFMNTNSFAICPACFSLHLCVLLTF